MKTTGVILVASLIIIGTSPSVAQMGVTENSLDAWVVVSSQVVRASVADVSYEYVNNRPTKGWIRTIVTLKVIETIKGKPSRSLTVGLGGYHIDRRYDGWKDAGTEVLWFLGPNSLYGKKEDFGEDEIFARYPLNTLHRIRLGTKIPEESGYEPAQPPIFTSTFDVLTDPGSILAAVRASVSYPSDRERAQALIPPSDIPAQVHSISVPRSIMARSGRVGDYNSISMPIDRRLETLARRMIKTPRDLLPIGNGTKDSGRQYDEVQLRAEGAKALRYFKSAENIAILEPLLNDPTTSHVTRPVEGKPDEASLEYIVRKEAVETLRAWAVKFKEPVLSIPDPTPPVRPVRP